MFKYFWLTTTSRWLDAKWSIVTVKFVFGNMDFIMLQWNEYQDAIDNSMIKILNSTEIRVKSF